MHTIWFTVHVQVGGGAVGSGVAPKLEVGIWGTDLAERHEVGGHLALPPLASHDWPQA